MRARLLGLKPKLCGEKLEALQYLLSEAREKVCQFAPS